MPGPKLDQEPYNFEVLVDQAKHVANTPKLVDATGAPVAVAERVLRTAQLSGVRLRAGRAPPRRPLLDPGRLAGAAFCRPWFALVFGPSADFQLLDM